jgi:HK97 family phage major capsid protein
MSTIKTLREKMANIATEARAKWDAVPDDATPEARAEVEREFDRMMKDHDALLARVEREEKLEAAEARANEGDARRPNGESRSSKAADAGSAVTYSDAFKRWLRAGGDMGALSPTERSMLLTHGQPEERVQTSITGAAGGFTVPTDVAIWIDKAMKMHGPMYSEDITFGINTSSGNPITVPTVDDTTKVAGLHTSGGAVTDDGSEDVVFGSATLSAYVYDSEWLKIAFELLADSAFNIEEVVGGLIGERLGRQANAVLTTGTGSSQPHGVVVGSSLGKTAASATAITSDEIIDLLHSVDPAYRSSPKARFMFNDTVLGVIRKLKGSDNNYLWQMGDITKGAPGTLLGHPYSINQNMASNTTGQKTILFGDFGKFYVRRVGAPVVLAVKERFAPDTGLLGLIRLDGRLATTGAIKHLIQL